MRRASGFSLVELMVGSTVGLLVLAGAVQLYSINVKASSENLRQARLSHDTRAMLAVMQRELMRSGYWAFDPQSTDPHDNPFTQQAEYLQIGADADQPDSSCILYSYDLNGDGLLGVGSSGVNTATTSIDNVEQFGIRLNTQRLQMRVNGEDYRCETGNWQTLNEETVIVNALRFEPETVCLHATKPDTACEAGQPAWLHSRIKITLVTSLADDADFQQTQTLTVDARNDQWVATW